MSSLNDVTTIPDQTAYRVKKRVTKDKDRERGAEVGLTAAAGAALASVLGMGAIKQDRQGKIKIKQEPVKKMKIAREFKKIAESDFYDNPDTPLPESTRKQAEKARKARNAISEYKKEAIRQRGWQMAEEMPQGVDVIGGEVNGMFVKEAKPDSVWRKDLHPKTKRRLLMNRGGFRGEPSADTRKRIMNRIIMQEQLGSMGTDTYFYRRKKGSPITMAQELITPAKDRVFKYDEIPFDMDRIDVLRRDRSRLIKGAERRGIVPDDIHYSNFGYDEAGNPKIMDLGHSATSDYEKLVRQSKFRKALNSTKNVMSPKNKRLYIKMAKQAAKRLPMIGAIASGVGIATAPNVAEAATDFAIDAGSMGLLSPESIGGGDLPPEVARKQKRYNELMMLEKMKKERKR